MFLSRVLPLLCRRAIRAAFKNRERGVILTTHYMEEAEAVCDRVAIMVSGQLRLVLLNNAAPRILKEHLNHTSDLVIKMT